MTTTPTIQINDTYPLYVAGRPESPNTNQPVYDKYTGELVTHVPKADPATIDRAIAAASAAAGPMAQLKAYQRQAILHHCIQRFEERRDELAYLLCVEAGKPISDSKGEVTRLIDTFRVAAEEAVRIAGDVLPLDISARAANHRGMVKRVPIGPCSFITPFNFPLNLVAHKVAPAIAAGCPFVLKPATNTPLGALVIGEILAETDLPDGAFSILVCSNDDAEPLVADDRLKLLSFTGSDTVGWKLKANAGKKKVHLELGGNAACIVDASAILDDAVKRIVFGSFYQSGQSCISVQRIYVHDAVYDTFKDKFLAAVRDLKTGDPKDENVFIGPLISEDAARRVNTWVHDAVQRGATLLLGGNHDGAIHEPTVLENAPEDANVVCEEIFGPVVTLNHFHTFDHAIHAANNSRFGLQAGLFTRDLYHTQQAWDQLEVGGVIVGDVPSWRVDHMPYGGVKDSGLGREGPRYAIEEMTEPRLLAIREP